MAAGSAQLQRCTAVDGRPGRHAGDVEQGWALELDQGSLIDGSQRREGFVVDLVDLHIKRARILKACDPASGAGHLASANKNSRSTTLSEEQHQLAYA